MTVEQALSRLCILWPHRVNDLTELIQVYSPALADLTPGELGDAVGMAVMECKFFPTPAELRAFAKPKREPEAEFDLIAGARANQAVNSLPQLPPGMTEAQAAARRLDWERLKADTLAAIRAGGDAVKQDRPTASQKLARVVEGYTPPAPNPAADRLRSALLLPRPITIICDNFMQDRVYDDKDAAVMMAPYPGEFYTQADHTDHDGHGWQTAIWHLR
jgi:hypothetical protein